MKHLSWLLLFIFFHTLSFASDNYPTQEEVAKLYVATFNRAPDSAGLNYWTNDSGLKLSEIAQSFFDQEETQTLYPSSTAHRDFIASVYQNLFNRDPDSAGWDYWEIQLTAGAFTKNRFIEAVINGALGDDATVLSNKTTVGIAFANAGLQDTYKAKSVMSGVTQDHGTVVIAQTTISGYMGTLVDTNILPVANAGSDQSVLVNNSIILQGTGSDTDGSIVSYEWKKGNTVLATTVSFTYTPTTVGNHTLTFTVADDHGAVASDTVNIQVTELQENITYVSNVSEFRKALENAALNGKNDTIVLDKGVYKTTEDGLGTFIFNDEEDYNLTIMAKEGLSRGEVILSGDNQHQILNFKILPPLVPKSLVRFHNLTIQEGKDEREETPLGELYAGGLFSNFLFVHIDACDFINNYRGFSVPFFVKIENSTISNNNDSGFRAGMATIDNAIISDNKGEGAPGGFFVGSAYIMDSTISNNLSNSGLGGGFNASFLLKMTRSVVSNNISYSQGGGGAFSAMAYCVVTNSVIANNSQENEYGTSYAVQSGAFTYIANSNFINNKGTALWTGNGTLINNIFLGSDTDVETITHGKIYNNYIDYHKIVVEVDKLIKKNNFQPTEGAIEFEEGSNYQFKSTSFGINKGINPDSSTFADLFVIPESQIELEKLPFSFKVDHFASDIVGNSRVVNGTIDLGAYELQ